MICYQSCLLICGLALMSKFSLAQDFPALSISYHGKNAILIGSSHVGAPAIGRLDRVQKLMQGKNSVCLENDPYDTETARIIADIVYRNPGGSRLADRIGSDIDIEIKRRLKWLGTSEAIDDLSPYAAGTLLMMEMKRLRDALLLLKPRTSLDSDIVAAAMTLQLKVHGIEDKDALPAAFRSLTNYQWQDYVSSILEILQCADCAARFEENMIKAFSASDDHESANNYVQQAMLEKPSLALVYNKMFYAKRNPGMARNILAALRRDHCDFIAVGAGHLGGANGVVELLKKSGATVTKINIRPGGSTGTPSDRQD